MEQSKLRLVIQLLTIVAKTGQWRNLFQLIYWAVMGKKSWDEAMERANGEFYAKQIKEATDQLKTSNPLAYTTRVNVPGYREYLASLEETTSDLHNKP